MAFVPSLFARATNANGTPESGAKRSVFLAGTTTPTTTFSDSSLTTPQAFPLVADAGGAFETSYLPAGRYKIRITDSDDNLLMPEHDNIRLADRPDDPVFFDSEADIIASTEDFAEGTYLFSLFEFRSYQVAASGATDHDFVTAGGEKIYRRRTDYSSVSDFISSTEPSRGEGEIWPAAGYRYEEAAASATDEHVTNAAGVKFYVLPTDAGYPVRAFGAVGDETTNDATIINTAISKLHDVSGNAILVGTTGDRYRVTESIWFGKDQPNDASVWWRANGSTFVGDLDNAPVVDLTGIQNGNRWIWDIRVETAAGKTPSYGILQARPAQSSGVVSSGNANLQGCRALGSFLAAGYASISSESNNINGCLFQNETGVAAAWLNEDYFSGTFTLPITSASGAFTPGETITGGGASAQVLFTNTGNTKLFCRQTSGTFGDGAAITGGTSASTATVSAPSGYIVCSDASPNAALGIETGSTSTFQTIDNVFFNNNDSTDLIPSCIVRGFNDISMTGANLNVANNTNTLLNVQGNVAGMSLFHPYLHSSHKYSILFGEEAQTSGTQNIFGFNLVSSYAGTPSGSRLKAANSTSRFFDIDATIYGEFDLGSSALQGQNDIKMFSRTGTGGAAQLTASGVLEGVLRGDADTVWNITSSASQKRARIYAGGTFTSFPSREAVVIDAGAITIERKLVLVDTEAAAATDTLDTINLDTNLITDCDMIYLRCLSASKVTTVSVSGGNIRGPANVDLDATTKLVPLIYDAAASAWYLVS